MWKTKTHSHKLRLSIVGEYPDLIAAIAQLAVKQIYFAHSASDGVLQYWKCGRPLPMNISTIFSINECSCLIAWTNDWSARSWNVGYVMDEWRSDVAIEASFYTFAKKPASTIWAQLFEHCIDGVPPGGVEISIGRGRKPQCQIWRELVPLVRPLISNWLDGVLRIHSDHFLVNPLVGLSG